MPPELRIPEDTATEKGILSTLCWEGSDNADAVAFLRDEDFMVPQHRWVFRALRSLHSESQTVNLLTLHDALGKMNALGKVGDITGLTEIIQGETYEKPMVLANILRRKSELRSLIHFGSNLARSASLGEQDPSSLITSASSELASMITRRPGKGLGLIGDIGSRAMANIEEVASGKRIPGVPTGLPKLDSVLGGGFKPGQLIILAARPGMGKTTMAMGWARRSASFVDPVAVWSLEMNSEELWTRLACAEAGMSSQDTSRGILNPTSRGRLEDAKDSLAQLPLLVNDQASITLPEIRAQFDRSVVQMGKICLVVIDYLQLMSSPEKKGQTEANRVADLSRGLKLFAKDAGVPVLVLSQLNRDVEKRTGGKPQLSDLRDSGAIEQDADIVLFLHRKAGCAENEAELHLAKQRNGPQTIIPLTMDLAHYKFMELERLTPAPYEDDDE